MCWLQGSNGITFNNMTSGFSISIVVKFSEIFNEEPNELKKYLTGISRSKMLHVCAFFLGFSNTQSKFEDFLEFLNMYFSKENNEFANAFYKKLITIKEKEDAQLVLITPLTTLQLFEYSFDNLDDKLVQSNAEAEMNILKSILLLNENNILLQDTAFATTKDVSTDLKPAAMALASSFPYSEFTNYDKSEVLASQMIKSFYLFEYLESNEQTNLIFTKFLEYFECEDWKSFLRYLLPLPFSLFKSKKEAHIDIVIQPGEKYEAGCRFLEKLIVSDSEALKDYDFKKVRSKPFYKAEEGVYRIIFGLFVLELVHKGVYFKLSEINNSLPKGDKIKNFRSLYCDEFSERVLLYKTLNSIYQNRYIEYSGSEIKETGIVGEPDYYIRNGSSLFLFESKDILINAEIKSTYDWNLYEQEFKKKLYLETDNDKTYNKAVLQLILNVKRSLSKEFEFDTNYKPRSLYIYPIIILHDQQFNLAGLNVIVNNWFQKELTKLGESGLPIQRVQPITIINIDTLIFHQDLFREKILRLDFIIDEYLKFITFDKKRKYLNEDHLKMYAERTVLNFALFVSNYVAEKNIKKTPKMIMEKGISLVNA